MYVAQDCVPEVVPSDKDARLLRSVSVNRKEVKKREWGDAQRESARVDKANGHFVSSPNTRNDTNYGPCYPADFAP